MSAPLPTQVFALLFKRDATVEVVAEFASRPAVLVVPNTNEGVTQIIQWILRFRTEGHEPLLCCAASPGASLGGIVFEELASSNEVKRFLLAQPWYIDYATRRELSPDHVHSVLLAYREQFPGGGHGA